MTRWWRRGGLTVLLFAIAGSLVSCDKSYDVSFTCIPGSAACPEGKPCSALPLGAGGCEALPGLFGHPETPVQSGRPVGCQVSLSYENPAYPGGPQKCTCTSPPQWFCAL